MSVQDPIQRLSLGQFADRFKSEMIPLGNRFCYFCAAVSLGEDDLKEYLDEPVAALPPVISARLPRIRILLVPYLEHEPGTGKSSGEALVSVEKPHAGQALSSGVLVNGEEAVLGFAIKDAEVADYHYRFYHTIAGIVAGAQGEGVPQEYLALLRHELRANAHGEVDEPSWTIKTALTGADRGGTRTTKRFRAYARASFIDTLTLYLHGICCDIDVETGPRQLASHLLRKRLRALAAVYPPPDGYAVLPEGHDKK
jgi:hypothetical protein